MTLSQDALERSDRSIVSLTTPDALSAIRRPGCAAAIWRREPPPQFQCWIDNLAPSDLLKSRLLLRADLVCKALVNLCRTQGIPEGPERNLLIEDAGALAAIFAQVARTRYLRLRLDVISDNTCRKFHVDAVTSRLVCTYRGTGTQYGISTDGAEPGRIFTVPTGSPIILRGTRWLETPVSGLVHRSPPIVGTGETRLVLVLDPVVSPMDEPGRQFMH